MVEQKQSREEIARREVGVTAISACGALVISLVFLLTIFSVPTIQLLLDDKPGIPLVSVWDDKEESLVGSARASNRLVLKNIDLLERGLEETSFLRSVFLPRLQYIFTRFLGYGNEKVLPGRHGYLCYRPAVDYLVGPPFLDEGQLQKRSEAHDLWETPAQPDPIRAILSFKVQLAARNIDLVLFPVPVKAAIYSSVLSEKDINRPLANRSLEKFIEILEHSGIAVFDSRALLYDFDAVHGNSYLPTDTHWSPAAMKMIAGKLADYLSEQDSTLRGSTMYRYHRTKNLGPGDLSRMLLLPDSDLYPDIPLEIDQVLSANGMFWQPDKDSPVLLLGDSFTNIYSSAGLGMGVSGGLAEHLSYQLKRGVDLLARNDDGAYSSREMLATELRRGRNRLAGKRVVVWQFAERELAFGDWRDIPLIEGTVESSDFIAVPSGSSIGVEATIADISHSPRPGTIPYRDNVVTLHLVDLQGSDVKGSARQALVYSFGMRDNEMTPIAGLRPGDRVSLVLSSWSDVENEYGSYRRTSLADEMIELELPNWGVLHENTTD